MMDKVNTGDVIQVTENNKDWCGCLLIVDEVFTWGVQAGMRIPYEGTAFLRLTWDQFVKIGEAIFIMDNYEE